MGQGFGLSFAAGGAADELQDILARRYAEQLQRQAAAERQRDFQRSQAQDAENTRRWNLTHDRQVASDKALADMRAAEAERDRAVAGKDAARQAGLQKLIDDPNTPPALRSLLQLNGLGVANVGIHDVEAPDAHAAHVRAENQLKADNGFADWQRRYDYQTAHPRPARIASAGGVRIRPGQDDPGLPFGTQRYLTEIRRKHQTFNDALGELSAYLQSPQTQSDHPGISPQRAANALRQLYTGAGNPNGGSGGSNPLVQQAVQEAMQGLGGGQSGERATTGPAAAPAGDVQLRERARAALRQRLGREASDDEISRVLANPRNRQLLSGGR